MILASLAKGATLPFGSRHREAFGTLLKEDKWMEAYTRAWRSVWAGGIAVLLGDRGNGKTQIGCELARSMRYVTAIAMAYNERNTIGTGTVEAQSLPRYITLGPAYCQAADIGLHVRESYNQKGAGTGPASTTQALTRFITPVLLVIDEVQEQLASEHDRQMLTRVLDQRYANSKPTVMIGNCTPEALLGFVGPSIHSRCYDGGVVIECKWPSFRTRGV